MVICYKKRKHSKPKNVNCLSWRPILTESHLHKVALEVVVENGPLGYDKVPRHGEKRIDVLDDGGAERYGHDDDTDDENRENGDRRTALLHLFLLEKKWKFTITEWGK